MPALRLLTATLACALTASASASLSDFSNWSFYRDPNPGPGTLQDAMVGSAAPNVASLDFLDDVNIPGAYDIGFSSVNANTVAEAATGYYFDASQDFTVAMSFNFAVTDPSGLVSFGLGIGQDRAGVNSAGVALGIGAVAGTIIDAGFIGAATNNNTPILADLSPTVTPFARTTSTQTIYAGSLTVSYDASSGDVTVGAGPISVSAAPSLPTGTVTFSGDTDLANWTDDDLLVSFFLRSGDPVGGTPWTGESAEANAVIFAVTEGSAIQIPEPTSLSLIALGGLAMMRRRRSA